MSNITVFLVFSSLLMATVAIAWLARVAKRLSALGMRVLESEDIEKIIDAADRTATFESRMTGCENRTEQSENKLPEHETKLAELAANLGATEEIANRNGAGFAELSEKMASFESRVAGCENRTEQSEDKLSEHETKVNELASKMEAVEQRLDEHAAGLAESGGSMKVLADEIQSLEEFQTATEKTRDLILTAFNNVRASMPPEECLETRVDTPAEPEEVSWEPED